MVVATVVEMLVEVGCVEMVFESVGGGYVVVVLEDYGGGVVVNFWARCVVNLL